MGFLYADRISGYEGMMIIKGSTMKTPSRHHSRGDLLSSALGVRSKTGSAFLADIHRRLSSSDRRDRIRQEWRDFINSALLPGSSGDVSGNEQAELELLGRQLYYALVVLAGALCHLYRLAGRTPETPKLSSLATGKVFPEFGVLNLGLSGFPAWFLDEIIDQALWAQVFSTLAGLEFNPGEDLFAALYRSLFPKKYRRDLGEHYTPRWLAAHILENAGYQGCPETRLIDPTCGSGVFLLEALHKARGRQGGREGPGGIVGLDLNPLAVMTAGVNYLIGSGHQPGDNQLEIPVYLGDALAPAQGGLPFALNSFDYVVGNPPWVNWEAMSPEYRIATRSIWRELGLFAHSGMETILGQGKKDLSMLITLACAAHLLADHGRLAFLITQSVFKSGGAAAGFRRFKMPSGIELKVLRVEDLTRMRPFPGASNRTAILYLYRGQPTIYPVPYIVWQDNGDGTVNTCEMMAEPVDRERPESPWMTCTPQVREAVSRILGKSGYQAREGANTGGANGVFWVEIIEPAVDGLVKIRNLASASRGPIPQVEAVIEEQLLYPLLKGKDLERWQCVPSGCIILTQDPVTRRGIPWPVMRREYPRTLEYLENFADILKRRAAYRRYFNEHDPFYSMFNVGEYTLAPVKVIWHRLGNTIRAAVAVGTRPVIPQETHVLIACHNTSEAWYLAGLLNSSPVRYALESYSMVGGKSFASPKLLNYLNLPQFVGSLEQLEIAGRAQLVAAGKLDDKELDSAVAAFYGYK